jgi:hypothetical protein
MITLDFETYYSDDYSLSKLTTEEYIRDPRFEPILMGYKIDDGHTKFVVGKDKIQLTLDSLGIENRAVLCHHAHFDGLILAHHFGHYPKIWFDTLSMARALHGTEVGGSLAKLMEYYQVGITKGTAVVNAKGMRLADFGHVTCSDALMHYGRYCCDDVEGTYRIFMRMFGGFERSELKQIDMVVRMFTEPCLLLDHDLLVDYARSIQAEKLTLLFSAGVTLDEVMSNEKFAEALRRRGVNPPMKRSPTTGKLAYAFAKTDFGLKELEDHPDQAVQTLVAARLGNKTTINETRALRMAGMAERGPACMYYNFAGAHQTLRLSGGDKTNWQNLQRGGTLRDAIYAPEGYVVVVVDSRNIEARVVDWLAIQEDALEVYRKFDRGEGPDVYCVMASKFYHREITKADKEERQLGKVIKLACGYQMGGERFQETARIMGGLTIDGRTADRGVQAYRSTHPMVVQLWNRAGSALAAMASPDEDSRHMDPRGLLTIEKNRIRLPSGLHLKYPELSFEGGGWSFKGRAGRTHIYGGKLVENAVQALARIVVMDQIVQVNKKYKAAMTTHDEGVFYVKEEDAEEALAFAIEVFSQPPAWAPDLPVAAEGKIAIRYGDAK